MEPWNDQTNQLAHDNGQKLLKMFNLPSDFSFGDILGTQNDAKSSDAKSKPLIKFWNQFSIIEINFDRKSPLDLKLIMKIMEGSLFIAQRHTRMWTLKFVESAKTQQYIDALLKLFTFTNFLTNGFKMVNGKLEQTYFIRNQEISNIKKKCSICQEKQYLSFTLCCGVTIGPKCNTTFKKQPKCGHCGYDWASKNKKGKQIEQLQSKLSKCYVSTAQIYL